MGFSYIIKLVACLMLISSGDLLIPKVFSFDHTNLSFL